MKKLLPLLLCILLLTGCAATYDGPTTTEEVLLEYVTVHKSSVSGNSWTARTVYAYDIYGNVASIRDYEDDELSAVIHYRYDDRGNLISSVRWDHTGLIPLPESRTESTYDDQDRILTRIYKNGWGREERTNTYTYDDEQYTMTFAASDSDTVTIYYYDENWKELRIDNNKGGVSTYTYDENGFLIRIDNYKDGALDRYSTYENDAQGRCLRYANYEAGGTCRSDGTYTYDDDAHTQTNTTGDGDQRIEYYDADGRIHLIEDYNAEGELVLYQQYTYREIRVPADREE